jgi:hypothetical protein
MWPFKKKKDETEDSDVSYVTISVSTLMRNILYDSLIKDPEILSGKLGLPPISEDVSEMEEEASQARLEKIHVLMPYIEAHSQLSSKIIFAGYSKALPIDDMTDELEETVHTFFELISFASALSCISSLVDLGLVETSVTGLNIYGK